MPRILSCLALTSLALGLLIASGCTTSREKPGPQTPTPTNVVTLTAENWRTEVVDSKIPVLVDFWAEWCGPCHALSPTIEKIADKYQGKIKVGKLNVDDEPTVSARFRVNAIPRVLLFNGTEEPIASFVGVKPEATYVSAIDKVLNKE